jgi:hypothetical protein
MRISVSTDPLSPAASLISVDSSGDGTVPAASMSGAAASTPVDGAWSSFLTDALATTVALDEASIDLAGALDLASGNYTSAEAANQGGYGATP